MEVIRSFLQDLRGCWKHNFWKKNRQTFLWGKKYDPFFLVLSSVKNLNLQFVIVLKVFQHYCDCYKINSLAPRRLLKTHFFEKKANFPVKKRFWPLLPPIIECHKPQRTVFKGTRGFFHHWYVCFKIKSLGPRMLLKTQIFEIKANFPVKKSSRPILPPIIECDKRQGLVAISPEASLTITLDKIRSFLQGLRGFWIHRFLKKKATFPVKKRFLALFLSFHQTYQSSGNNFWGSKRFFDSYCGSYIIISSGLERLLKTQFLKKKQAIFPVRKNLWPPFSRFIECHKLQRTVC